MNFCHAILRTIERRHAINPGVHIATIEYGKTHDVGKDVMKRIPIDDLLGWDFDRWHGRPLDKLHRQPGAKCLKREAQTEASGASLEVGRRLGGPGGAGNV